MKIKAYKLLICAPVLTLIAGATIGCNKKNEAKEIYLKNISEIAAQYNKGCPRQQANGATLESVTFEDSVLVFRSAVSQNSITTINLDNARDSIIKNISPTLKSYLIKGDCNLEYRYVAPRDSSSITIIPKELQQDSIK